MMSSTTQTPPTPEASQTCHILALEIVGRDESSAEDFRRSVAILAEVLAYCDAFTQAKATGALMVQPVVGGLFLLFLNELTAPVVCAMELCEILPELPSMSVRMAIHSGTVRVAPGPAGESAAAGEGIDIVRTLVNTAEPGEVLLSKSYADGLAHHEVWSGRIESGGAIGERYRIEPQRLVFLDSGLEPVEVLDALETALLQDGHQTSDDRRSTRGVDWAKSIESTIRSADTVVAIVSDFSAQSEMLQYQLEIAIDERRKRGRPQILPVWLKEGPPTESPLSSLNRSLHHAIWKGEQDNERVVAEVRAALADGQVETDPESLGSPVGAVASESGLYIKRSADRQLEDALDRSESIVLVKGPRQIGKTSMINRGIEFVRARGARCATTDFQNLSDSQLKSEDSCYRIVAATLARQANFEFDFEAEWLDEVGPTRNMDTFVRELLESSEEPLTWFIDEADRLFSAPYASDFFGLIRLWHNARATDPMGSWGRLTVVIGYATEAHLFIRDLNRSPFNVGVPISLEMFTLANMGDLNELYGRPIANGEDLRALHSLVGGQPFLTRRAFDILARGTMTVETLLRTADQEDGPFGDHLRRILMTVTQLPEVWKALVESLSSPVLSSADAVEGQGFLRLVSAGILIRGAGRRFELRFELYKRYFARFLTTARDA